MGHPVECFQQRYLHPILHIHWSERRTNISVLESACLPSIETMIHKSQLRWAGHVVRMPDNRLPKQLLFYQLTHGVRPASGPKLRFKDIIKHNIKAFGTTTGTWEQAAMEWSKYRALLHSRAMLAEATRVERMKEKCRRCKDRTSPEAGDLALTCPHCGRQWINAST